MKFFAAAASCSVLLSTPLLANAAPTNASSLLDSILNPSVDQVPKAPAESSATYELGTYFINWAIYARNYFVTDLPYTKLTKVLYAFANINNVTGAVTLSDEYSDLQYMYPTDVASNGTVLYGNFNQLYKLKQKNRNLKVILSVGGWTYRGNFSPGLSTDAGRALFANTTTQLIADLGIDGIDIDWEYPADSTDAANILDTVKKCRTAYDDYASKHANGYHFELGISASAGPTKYEIMPVADMDPYVDYWNLMAFDYMGAGFSNFTGHNSQLYPSKAIPRATDFNTEQAVEYYTSHVSSSTKVHLGLPMYGRSFANAVQGNTQGLGQKFNGSGVGTWEAGVVDYKAIPLNTSDIFYDHQTEATWSYNKKTREFLSFDTTAVQAKKAQYVQAKKLGGAWWWDSSSDRTDELSLTTTVSNALGGVKALKQSQNWLSYPVSKYDNIRAASSSNGTYARRF